MGSRTECVQRGHNPIHSADAQVSAERRVHDHARCVNDADPEREYRPPAALSTWSITSTVSPRVSMFQPAEADTHGRLARIAKRERSLFGAVIRLESAFRSCTR